MRRALCLLLALGCSKARSVSDDTRGLTWQDDIGPLFQARCVSCHAGSAAAGNYQLTQYLGALGSGTHAGPDAVAGAAGCVLLTTLDPTQADAVHQPVSDVFSTVSEWVVADRLAFFHSSIHGGGILNPADLGFHGAVLEDAGWDFSFCASCHGQDFSGGPSQVSCTGCHAQGVTACGTCHGPFGQSGSHATHVDGGALGHGFDCTECHVKPAAYTDVGHLFDASGNLLTSPAAVTFGPLASLATPQRTGPPTWNAGTQTCTNVYCHGGAFADSNASNSSPRFDLPGTGQAKCGTCHGLPPSNHAAGQSQCALCHGRVVGADGGIIAPALHLNGVVDLGDGSGTCHACHGDATSAAPPRDLAGNTATTALGVGAHRSHVQALHKLSVPVPCGGCHYGTPLNVNDPGHIDSPLPAPVFPNAGGLAFADGAIPSWNRGAATCAGSYCHGGGTHLADDASSGLLRAPVWTSVGTDQAACGTCHGIPPQDGVPGHDAGAPLTSCAACHPATIDPTGALIVVEDGGVWTSAHINGVIDHVP